MVSESYSLLCLDTPTSFSALTFYTASEKKRGVRGSLGKVISSRDSKVIPRFDDITLEIILAPTTLVYFNTETENTND